MLKKKSFNWMNQQLTLSAKTIKLKRKQRGKFSWPQIWQWILRYDEKHNKNESRTSPVEQWLRIRLPMQGTQVRALVWEDPTCCGATNPVRHNYRACTLELESHNYWSPCTESACSATREATAVRSLCTATKSSPRSPQLEKAPAQQRPNAAKYKL